MTDDTTDDPTPPSSPDPTRVGGDAPGGIDFGALVAAHNTARTGPVGTGNGPSSDPVLPPLLEGPPPEQVDGASRRSRRAPGASGRSPWWRFGYPTVIALVVVLLVPLLVSSGLQIILDSSDGRLVKRVTDPAAPGYEAVVTKTPTAVVAMVGADDSLSGIAVLALTSATSGGVLLLPPTIAYPSAFGALPTSVAWDADGIDGVATAVGLVLDLSFSERLAVRSTDWAALVASAGPLALTLPDAVRDAKDAIVLAKGPSQIKADQVGVLVDGKGAKESELNRTLRQELFWTTWIAQLHSTGATVPGPASEGLGRFLGPLSLGQVSVSSLPVTPMAAAPPLPQRYEAVEEPAADAVAAIVPFPDGAPGGRPRVRVLDGTGRLGNGLGAAIQLNAGGGQVDVVGNAKSFGQRTTQILWFDGSSEKAAQKMKDALGGIGEIVKSKATNSASDITVTLGDDYLQMYGPAAEASVTTTVAR